MIPTDRFLHQAPSSSTSATQDATWQDNDAAVAFDCRHRAMMYDLLPTFFKLVSTTFAIAAIITGLQALFLPTTFAQSFGLPIQKLSEDPDISISTVHGSSYVSLMGVRQLATGVTLLAFAYQGKWREAATVLSIIGVLVAGTDGLFLAKAGRWKEARFHAIPGAGIALLAAAFLLKGD